MTIDPWLYPVFFLTSLFAGCIDAIAGGGGLIVLPVLLSTGMPVSLALGTNKVQSTMGSFTASYYYARKGVVNWREAAAGIFFTFLGAALGAAAAQTFANDVLADAIPFLLAGVLLYSLLTPKIGEMDAKPRVRPFAFALLFGLTLGFYDGFFGPGTGSFWAIAYIGLLGMNFLKATAYTKVMNFTSNIVSAAIFIIGGNVLFPVAITMAAGQIIGARLGASLVVTRGVRFIRPVFIAIVCLTVGKLILDRLWG